MPSSSSVVHKILNQRRKRKRSPSPAVAEGTNRATSTSRRLLERGVKEATTTTDNPSSTRQRRTKLNLDYYRQCYIQPSSTDSAQEEEAAAKSNEKYSSVPDFWETSMSLVLLGLPILAQIIDNATPPYQKLLQHYQRLQQAHVDLTKEHQQLEVKHQHTKEKFHRFHKSVERKYQHFSANKSHDESTSTPNSKTTTTAMTPKASNKPQEVTLVRTSKEQETAPVQTTAPLSALKESPEPSRNHMPSPQQSQKPAKQSLAIRQDQRKQSQRSSRQVVGSKETAESEKYAAPPAQPSSTSRKQSPPVNPPAREQANELEKTFGPAAYAGQSYVSDKSENLLASSPSNQSIPGRHSGDHAVHVSSALLYHRREHSTEQRQANRRPRQDSIVEESQNLLAPSPPHTVAQRRTSTNCLTAEDKNDLSRQTANEPRAPHRDFRAEIEKSLASAPTHKTERPRQEKSHDHASPRLSDRATFRSRQETRKGLSNSKRGRSESPSQEQRIRQQETEDETTAEPVPSQINICRPGKPLQDRTNAASGKSRSQARHNENQIETVLPRKLSVRRPTGGIHLSSTQPIPSISPQGRPTSAFLPLSRPGKVPRGVASSSEPDDSQTIIPPARAHASPHYVLQNLPRVPSCNTGIIRQAPIVPDGIRSASQRPNDDSQTVIPPTIINHKSQRQRPVVLPQSKKQSVRRVTASPHRILEHLAPKTKTGGGWVSTHSARSFVQEGANNVASKSKTAAAPKKMQQPSAKPAPSKKSVSYNPYNKQATANSTVAAAAKEPAPFRYQEVVRGRAEREKLKAYDCPDCGKFIDAVMEGDGANVFERHELMCSSRHRARHTPPSTPEDFWELSFRDEIEKRKQV